MFGVPPSTSANSAALQATISIRSGDQPPDPGRHNIDGLIAAYTSAAPDGNERIYLNASWLELATAEQIEAVLLEELGHAIDRRLNGSADTPVMKAQSSQPCCAEKVPIPRLIETNDQRILNIDGVAVAVEASIDTTRPTGSLGVSRQLRHSPQLSPIPSGFRMLAATPARPLPMSMATAISISSSAIERQHPLLPQHRFCEYSRLYPRRWRPTPLGSRMLDQTVASPAFADIDGDGDLDLFIGNYDGDTIFFRNTAAPGATRSCFHTSSCHQPFGITEMLAFASPAFADIDGDGDLDLFIGNYYGGTFFFRNTAARRHRSSRFHRKKVDNPLGSRMLAAQRSPAFADIDGDGDLDLFIGNNDGDTVFFRNTGSAPPTPAYAAAGNQSLRDHRMLAIRQPGLC